MVEVVDCTVVEEVEEVQQEVQQVMEVTAAKE
jgi:hypothetical protein